MKNQFRQISTRITLALCCLSTLAAHSQNMVLNPGFEDYFTCPEDYGAVDVLADWYITRGTPDYFNSCFPSPSNSFSVPENIRGFQHAVDGMGYIGLLTYGSFASFYEPDKHEFATGTLSDSLVVGMSYDVSFWANLSDISQRANNRLGARFSKQIPYHYGWPNPIQNFSHIYSEEINSDSIGWTLVSGSFIADSAYKFISIGNHYNDQLTDTTVIGYDWVGSYYLIDAVSVVPSQDFVFVDADTTLCTGQQATFHAYGPAIGWALASDPDVLITDDPVLHFIPIEGDTLLAIYPDTTFTVIYTVNESPELELGPDFGICEGQLHQIDMTTSGNISWQDGSTDLIYTITEPGIYSATTTSNGCVVTDYITAWNFPENAVVFPEDFVLCSGDTVRLEVDVWNFFEVIWQDGTNAEAYEITGPGSYWATIQSGDCIATDSIHVGIEFYPIADLGNDTAICAGQWLFIDLPNGADYYQWADGFTTPDRILSEPGTYSVVVSNGDCVVADTLEVSDFPFYLVEFPDSLAQCGDGPKILSVDESVYTVVWQDGSTGNTYAAAQSGLYWASVTSGECVSSDTVYVTIQPYAEVSFGADTILCPGSYFVLDAGNEGFHYQWQDGSTNQYYQVTQAGPYVVEVYLNGCYVSEGIVIDFYPEEPSIYLGPDTVMCEEDTHTLYIEGEWQSVLWSNGSTGNEITIDEAGSYWVQATNTCSVFDTIYVAPGYCNCRLYLPYVLNIETLGVNELTSTDFNCPVEDFSLKIFDPLGRLIDETNDLNWIWEPEISLAYGVYIFDIRYRFEHESESRHLAQKVLITKL